MNDVVPKLARCAVYTRKSTEHNLDLAFTALDAQREACEAYIRSQAGEGWRLLPGRHDDGGLSGASLDRPALQALLAAVRARREGKAERYVRQLAPLAFVSPRIITAIMAGTAPAALTVTTLAAALPYSWAEQEQRLSRS
jgi:Resolvase, N terminal domain